MSGSWKKVIITISIMLCVGIACTAWNVALDKMTGSIGGDTQQDSYNSDNLQGQYYEDNTNAGGTIQGNASVTGVIGQQNSATPNNQGGSASQSGYASQNGSSSQGASQQAASNVLSFSKNQLIAYYNNCLKNSYSQSRMTDTKVEHVDVSVKDIDIGNLNIDVDKFANSIIENNTKNNDKPNTKTFSRGVASDGTAASTFVLPTNLYAAAVKTANVNQNGNGYVVTFTLNQESCSHTGTAAYNASCAWPLDINSIDFGSAVTIQSCTFNYPGTKLTANIDSQGRVSSVKVEMPLTVSNAQGKALGVTIKVGAISGKWICTNTMTF